MNLDEQVLLALLRGCRPVYDDYGHPERAAARNYWRAPLPDGRIAYGYTHNGCCRVWAAMLDSWEKSQ